MSCLLFALLAVAGADEERFMELFVQARAAYGDVDLGRAHDGFIAAAAAAPDARRRGDALLWAGMSAGQAGRQADATAAFAAALAVDGGARLPAPVSPKVEALFARARASFGAPVPIEGTQMADAPAQEPRPALLKPTENTSVVPPLLWAAGGGVGAVAIAVAAAAAFDAARAYDVRTSQRAAQEALDAANFKLALAVIAAVVGAVAGIAGTSSYFADAPAQP